MINHKVQEIAWNGAIRVSRNEVGSSRRSIKGLNGEKGREWATFKNNFQKRLTGLGACVKKGKLRFNRRDSEVEAAETLAHPFFLPSDLHSHQYGSISAPRLFDQEHPGQTFFCDRGIRVCENDFFHGWGHARTGDPRSADGREHPKFLEKIETGPDEPRIEGWEEHHRIDLRHARLSGDWLGQRLPADTDVASYGSPDRLSIRLRPSNNKDGRCHLQAICIPSHSGPSAGGSPNEIDGLLRKT